MKKNILGSFDIDGDGEVDLFETAYAFETMEEADGEDEDDNYWSSAEPDENTKDLKE